MQGASFVHVHFDKERICVLPEELLWRLHRYKGVHY